MLLPEMPTSASVLDHPHSEPTATSIFQRPTLDGSTLAFSSLPPPPQLFPRQTSSPDDTTGNDDVTSNDRSGVINYYFIFFALLMCIAILCVYFVWRRRRNALRIHQAQHGDGFRPNVREWDTMRYRRRYWNTHNRTEHVSREEGLNENGEAPPPYMPKEDEQTGNAGYHHVQGGGRPGEPAIPMQTLSREQAGLNKPPGYEQSVQQGGGDPSGSRPTYG